MARGLATSKQSLAWPLTCLVSEQDPGLEGSVAGSHDAIRGGWGGCAFRMRGPPWAATPGPVYSGSIKVGQLCERAGMAHAKRT